jgi:hypothetical protein
VQATDATVVYPTVLNRILGTRFKVVPGYHGTSEVALAVERGEVGGVGSWNYSSLLATRPDWLRDRKVNVLLQVALEPGVAARQRLIGQQRRDLLGVARRLAGARGELIGAAAIERVELRIKAVGPEQLAAENERLIGVELAIDDLHQRISSHETVRRPTPQDNRARRLLELRR